MPASNPTLRRRLYRLAPGAAIAGALLLYSCGGSSPMTQARRLADPPVASDPDAGTGLPRIVSSGGFVQALWQAPLVDAHVVGGLVVGLVAGEDRLHELRALSELTGQAVWSASLPSGNPDVLGLIAGSGVVVVGVGHDVGEAPAAVFPVVTGEVVFEATSGRELWSAPVEQHAGILSHFQHPPIALSGGVLVTGDAAGNLTARTLQSGAPAWTQPRPTSCPQGRGSEEAYDEALAAHGPLLAVSYQCHAAGRTFAQARRLSPSTGKMVWSWDSPRVRDTTTSFVDLSVVAAAVQGDTVLLYGQVARAGRLADMLPHARRWPTILGAFGEGELLVALDSRSGRPRWSEQGGQENTITMSDGATCETDQLGFECRDDGTGLPSRPLVRTTRSEADAPPYLGDGYSGITGALAGLVLGQQRSGAASIAVYPLHGRGLVARASVELGRGVYGGANYQSFIVAAGPLPHGETLLLLRRVDVANYPLVALGVTPARHLLREPPPPKPKHPHPKRGPRIYVASQDCRGRTFEPHRLTLDCAHPKRLYLTEIDYFAGAGEGYGTARASGSMTIHVLRCHPDCAKGNYHLNKGALTLERPVLCADGFLYYSRAFYSYPEGQAQIDIQPHEHCRPHSP